MKLEWNFMKTVLAIKKLIQPSKYPCIVACLKFESFFHVEIWWHDVGGFDYFLWQCAPVLCTASTLYKTSRSQAWKLTSNHFCLFPLNLFHSDPKEFHWFLEISGTTVIFHALQLLPSEQWISLIHVSGIPQNILTSPCRHLWGSCITAPKSLLTCWLCLCMKADTVIHMQCLTWF